MSENQNRSDIDFGKYDSMTTDELEEILRLDAEMPEGQESDINKILYIMEVLAERKTNNSHTGNTTLEAYESFKQNYMPETDNETVPVKVNRRFPHWVRSLTAVAAVLAILLVGSATAKAFGFNIWKNVVQWTQDTFNFGNSDLNGNLTYSSLGEALKADGITTPIAPTWLPDGYELVDITVDLTPQKKTYKAKYENGEQILRITVRDHLDGVPVYTEQSDGLIEEYEASGNIYYIFKDVNLMKATWITDSYECSISGNITIEELKMMIDSIEKG